MRLSDGHMQRVKWLWWRIAELGRVPAFTDDETQAPLTKVTTRSQKGIANQSTSTGHDRVKVINR